MILNLPLVVFQFLSAVLFSASAMHLVLSKVDLRLSNFRQRYFCTSMSRALTASAISSVYRSGGTCFGRRVLPSFLLTETHHKQCAAQRVTCVSKSAHVRAQPCLKFSATRRVSQECLTRVLCVAVSRSGWLLLRPARFCAWSPLVLSVQPGAYRRCLPLRTLTSPGGALFFSGPALRGRS